MGGPGPWALATLLALHVPLAGGSNDSLLIPGWFQHSLFGFHHWVISFLHVISPLLDS